MRQRQADAEEIRPLIDRQGEAAADEIDEFAVGLALQSIQLAAA